MKPSKKCCTPRKKQEKHSQQNWINFLLITFLSLSIIFFTYNDLSYAITYISIYLSIYLSIFLSIPCRASSYGLMVYSARQEFIIQPIVHWLNARYSPLPRKCRRLALVWKFFGTIWIYKEKNRYWKDQFYKKSESVLSMNANFASFFKFTVLE